jgi:hypothetical protein
LYGAFQIDLVQILEAMSSDIVYRVKRMNIYDAESGKIKERVFLGEHLGEERKEE